MENNEKIICLDTSNWINWLDNLNSINKNKRQLAEKLKQKIEKTNIKFLVTFEHIAELLGGEIEEYKEKRISKIKEFNNIIYLNLQTNSNKSFVNITTPAILALELMVESHGLSDIIAIKNQAKKLLISKHSQTKLYNHLDYKKIKEKIKDYQIFLDAISSIDEDKIEHNEKIKNFTNIQHKTMTEKTIKIEKEKILLNLKKAKTINDDMAETLANEYILFIEQKIKKMNDDSPVIYQILESMGVEKNKINDNSTIVDLIIDFVTQNEENQIRKIFNIQIEKEQKNQSMIPSREVIKSVYKWKQFRLSREGSCITDISLLSLSPYCDIQYVDKRTAEDIKRAKQKNPILEKIMAKTLKSGSFLRLINGETEEIPD